MSEELILKRSIARMAAVTFARRSWRSDSARTANVIADFENWRIDAVSEMSKFFWSTAYAVHFSQEYKTSSLSFQQETNILDFVFAIRKQNYANSLCPEKRRISNFAL